MDYLLILMQITLINCLVNKTNVQTSDFSIKRGRFKKCSLGNFEEVLGKTFDVFSANNRFSGVNGNVSANDCVKEATKKNVWNDLLLHDVNELTHSHWLEYKSMFGKVYRSLHHEMAALTRWRQNLARVAEHNRRYLAGELSYTLHLNQFGDWDSNHYFSKILKLFDTIPLPDPAKDRHSATYHRIAHVKTPREVDWRKKGFRPRREEQWKCGACYAFAVTHALQAQLYRKHGEWGELSPQQIVDCSGPDGNMGCDGGSLRAAMRYTARSGLISEKHYPYTGKKGRCKYRRGLVTAKPASWSMLPAGDEGAMEKALATIGPLAVAVNAAPFTFQLYRSGIYDDPFCFDWTLNHAMLLVGYTQEYWILLNWWGRNWGEDGYIRIRRGLNRCGVANMAAYVVLK